MKYALPILNKMPKDQSYLLGDSIQTMPADLLEHLLEAYYAPPNQKKAILTQFNLLIEKLRYFFRLGYDLGYYNSTRYHDFAAKIYEISKMRGGWIKSLDPKRPLSNTPIFQKFSPARSPSEKG